MSPSHVQSALSSCLHLADGVCVGLQDMPQQQSSHAAPQQEQTADMAAALARGSTGQGYPSGALSEFLGLTIGEFPWCAWSAKLSLGQVLQVPSQG